MAFAVKYRAEFKDRKGTDWKIDVLEDGFSGSITTLRLWGNNPLKIKFRASNVKLKHSPICPKSVEISFVSDTDYALLEFFYTSSKTHLFKIYEGVSSTPYFTGWVLNGLGGETYVSPPYEVKLKVSDGLAELSNIKFEKKAGDNLILGDELVRYIYQDIIGITNTYLLDNSNIFPVDFIVSGPEETSLNSLYINQTVFIENDMNVYEVLEDLMLTHNCRFYQMEDSWVVDSLEQHNPATNITYKKFLADTLVQQTDLVITQPIILHTDIKTIGSSSISFIEAPKTIEVETIFTKRQNILGDEGLDGWGGIADWPEMNSGMFMSEVTDSFNGYAALGSFNYQTVNGETVLGIGKSDFGDATLAFGISNPHQIISVNAQANDIYDLVFIAWSAVPAFPTTGKLFIKGKGIFEITTAAASTGTSNEKSISVRTLVSAMIPEEGDVIIGDINKVSQISQTLQIEGGVKDALDRSDSIILKLDIDYATQWYSFSGSDPVDDGLSFIGIKAGNVGDVQDTFNGTNWDNLSVNTSNTTYSQVIEFPQTKHEQYENATVEIPLDWDSLIGTEKEIHIVLFNSYARATIYKKIGVSIITSSGSVYSVGNVLNNNTSIEVKSTLFNSSEIELNSEYKSNGGLFTSNGFSYNDWGNKTKNALIANLVKSKYSDNVQIFKGTLDGIFKPEKILTDNKNFGRTFQIQELTQNINQQTTTVTAVEITPGGIINEVYLIGIDEFEAFFTPHVAASTSTFDVVISNNGNVAITVTGSSSGSHFTVSANQLIPAFEDKTFTITSTADTLDNYTETVSFVDTLANTNTVEIICSASVILIATAPFNFKLLTHFPIVLAERYDFDEPQLHDTIIVVEQIDTPHPDMEINASPVGDWKSTLRTQDTFLWNLYNETADQEGLFTGSYQFFDQATDNAIDVDAEINIITGLRMAQNPEVSGIIQNRVRIDGGAWIDIVPGVNNYINFLEGEEFDWNLETSGDLEDIQMAVHLHGSQGTLLTFVGTAVDFSHTLTFIPFVLAGDAVSVEISIQDVS